MPDLAPSRPFPLPSDRTAHGALVKAAFASYVSACRGARGGGAEACARSLWPNDAAVAVGVLQQRAAQPTALTTAAGWAQELVAAAVASFLGSLMPQSAASTLIAQGTRVNLDGAGKVTVPGRVTAGSATYVGEAAPIPVTSLPMTGTTLTPLKLGILITVSRELELFGTGGLPLFEQLLVEVASMALDLAISPAREAVSWPVSPR